MLCRNAVIVETGLKGFIANPDDSPFLLAGYYGNPAIIETMLAKYEALLDQQDSTGKTILHICASRGNPDALKYLCSVLHEDYLNVFTKLGRNAIWYAACGGHLECSRLLLEHNVNSNMTDNFDMTPLAAACKEGHIEVLKLLVQAGTNINAKNSEGMTPLMQAAIAGQGKLVKLLVELGADVNLPDLNKMTPLHHAAVGGKSNMCSLLVNLGANLNACDKKLRTPLHSAVYYGRSVVAVALVRLGANVSTMHKAKNTCPAAAISCGHFELAKQLEAAQ
jgi:ankyrin repeat protein